MSRIVTLAIGITLCMALGACGGKDEPKGPSYTPMPDADLYSQIEALPGVTSVDIKHLAEFGNSNDYVGDIEVEGSADGVAILDQAFAILRQGRAKAAIGVHVLQEGKQISASAFGLNSTTDRRLTERYGPQPGDGKPPAPTP